MKASFFLLFVSLQFVCLCVLLCCSSSGLVQGLPLELKMKSSNARDRHKERTYSETMGKILSFPSLGHVAFHRKPRNINAILNLPSATVNGRLHSRSGGYFLKINNDGRIGGTTNICSEYGKLTLTLQKKLLC